MNGIAALSAEEYHADPCDRPSLSASIAHILCTSSPRHAWAAHPRLNPKFEREEKEHFDVGTVAHQLVLDSDTTVKVIDAPDWRTNAAKEARDDARANGWIPLLSKHYDAVSAMYAAACEQLAAVDVAPPVFTDGKPEQTLVWEDEGVPCRARLDWLRDDRQAVDDYKTTSRSANPESWSRTLFGNGCDVQAAFYLRGLAVVTGATDAEFRFVVQETFPPYALSVVALGPDVLTLARKKVGYALQVWRSCLASGEWPAYPTRVCWAQLPPWEEERWLMKEEREVAA